MKAKFLKDEDKLVAIER